MSHNEIINDLRDQMREIEKTSSSDYFEDIQKRDRTANNLVESSPDEHESSSCSSDSHAEEPHKKDAFSRIVGLINASDKSEFEIRRRLNQANFSDDQIDEAVERAKRYKIIDDDRFAHILIQSRIHQGWGSSGIERELSKNNIDPTTVDGWPYDYDLSDDVQFERAFELLRNKPPRAKNLRESAYRKLVQKGYSSSIASRVAREWSTQVSQGSK